MKTLIIYPHGLGDCLMLTPSLREYYNKYGVKLSVAILERFSTSKIFKNNPYVEKVFPVLKDAWNDFSSPQLGFIEVQKMGQLLAKENNLINVFLDHPRPTHKILVNAQQLNLVLESTDIDVFISDNEKLIANELIEKFVGNNPYGFIQTHTGAGNRELPEGFGEKWLRKAKDLEYFIEVDKTYKHKNYSINVQFEILRRASAVCLPDSVYYHACVGLKKTIDFAFFPMGDPEYLRVKNLDLKVKENIFYKIPEI